ncbi:MAG TPA: LPS assembly lipoprotein LptE [Spirochaetota bacterium]|nr:LPS assembly lipoprotein LptE [Spirochaetota bacterium]
MRKLFILLSLLLLLTGCSLFHNGEAISGQIKGGTIIPDSAGTIYIISFTGGTNGAEFNNEFARRLKRIINLDGRLSVVESVDESDLILDASPVRYSEENVRFDETGRPVLRRISITVRVTLSEKSTGRIIIKDKETDLFTEYNPDSAIMNDVYRELADRSSAAVLSIILTGWAVDTSPRDTRDL